MKTKIKIIFAFALLSVFGFTSCNSDVEAKKVSDSISVVEHKKDSSLLSYINTLNEIDSNLDLIRDKRGLIVMGPNSNVEEGVSKKEQILRNIAMINFLLDQNQQKIISLEKQVSQTRNKNVSLKAITNDYKKRIEAAEAETAQLKEQLAALSFSKDELEGKYTALQMENSQLVIQKSELESTVTAMDTKIHTAYYTIGNYKDLKNSKVITKKGTLIGIGRTPELSPNFNKEAFTTIDTKTLLSIPLNADKATLITNHPAQAYQLEKNTDGTLNLHITDPDLFWSVSKYLVIEIKS